MKIDPDETELMINNPNGFQNESKINGLKLKAIEYLGLVISNE